MSEIHIWTPKPIYFVLLGGLLAGMIVIVLFELWSGVIDFVTLVAIVFLGALLWRLMAADVPLVTAEELGNEEELLFADYAWHLSQGVSVKTLALSLAWSELTHRSCARAKSGILHLTNRRLIFKAADWSQPAGDRTLSIPLRSVLGCVPHARKWRTRGHMILETMGGNETFAANHWQSFADLIRQELAAASEQGVTDNL
jgi:hypothetical protein